MKRSSVYQIVSVCLFALSCLTNTSLSSATDPVLANVVSRPFPVSISVTTLCQKYNDNYCQHVQQTLDRMAQELRDPNWAPQTEEQIKANILGKAVKYRIRRIECRSSICAAEVLSFTGEPPYYGGIGQERLNKTLLAENVLGEEQDSSGNYVCVSLTTFVRR